MSRKNNETQNETDNEQGPLKLAVMSDIHVHEHGRGMYRDLFTEISKKADVLAICGDLTDLGMPSEAHLLAEDLQECTIPTIGVLGNHDYHCGNAEEVKQILTEADFIFLEDQTFEYGGVGFAGVKGFAGGFERRMLGSFGEQSLKNLVSEVIDETLRLEHSLTTLRNDRIVVILHYAPIADTLEGEPLEIYPFLGCSRFAETIDRFDVDVVFHGHAHIGTYEGKTNKGIPVFNVALPIMKKRDPEHPYVIYEV